MPGERLGLDIYKRRTPCQLGFARLPPGRTLDAFPRHPLISAPGSFRKRIREISETRGLLARNLRILGEHGYVRSEFSNDLYGISPAQTSIP
jgi:hypothetical protein